MILLCDLVYGSGIAKSISRKGVEFGSNSRMGMQSSMTRTTFSSTVHFLRVTNALQQI